ncbi:MAG: sulfide/dihydroorotate dehydrogenase-like FAD/NAD-binding protein [Candidatus Bathyarchaeia archaeon]
MQKTSSQQYKITQKQQLNSQVKLLKIYAPDIAQKAKAGQFVILKTRPNSERIPLTIAAWDKGAGTITLVFQEVGFSTIELGKLLEGEEIQNLAGPLGNPSDIKNYGKVAVVCGGVGTAAAYPIARALKEANNIVVTIMGARNKDLLILENEMKQVSDEFYIATDDGSKGQTGLVTEVLKTQITQGTSPFNVVYAVGPPMMMNAVSEATRPHKIKTIVSLNPIMVDGMGMCGACRVSVADKVRFACVEGPEFDAHQVNFKELVMRLRSYSNEEKLTSQITENFGRDCTCHNK